MEDSQCLQRVIDKVKQWCDEWLLPLNVSKCNVMSFTSKVNLDTSYCIINKDSRHIIQKVDSIKDLGILFDTRLNFKDHIQEKINKAYNMIGLLKRNFIHVDCYTFILLYKALVRPHLEYANSVWSPYKKCDIEQVEKIQRRATKLVISLRKFPYKERLLRLNLYTLKYRRLRGDMIEVFKLVNNVYDNRVAPSLSYDMYVTRGNKFKLQNQSFNHNYRKFFFSARIVNMWNSLPNYVVDVQSIDVFRVHLDQLWAQQEVMFDWTADLTGTRDRSEYTVESN